jgi:hypothetical protein
VLRGCTDIRRLSGCLLFLGELTAPSSSSGIGSHPYAALFSKAGNAVLWQDIIQRAKRMAFAQMNRPEHNPLAVTSVKGNGKTEGGGCTVKLSEDIRSQPFPLFSVLLSSFSLFLCLPAFVRATSVFLNCSSIKVFFV